MPFVSWLKVMYPYGMEKTAKWWQCDWYSNVYVCSLTNSTIGILYAIRAPRYKYTDKDS
jgi:hypothetical protein